MTDRAAAVKAAYDQIEKNFGAGSIVRLGDRETQPIDTISTGSIALDNALGVGGFPRGRIVEIYGAESCSKTTVALHTVANAQKTGTAAYIDVEHSLDPAYASAIGVDTDNLLLSQPDTAEQAFEIIDLLVASGGIDVVVLDSVAALLPRAELEGNYGDSHVGLQSRLMSQAMRKLTGAVHKSNTLAIFINQVRSSISPYGPSEVTSGGKALKFYSSVRVDLRRSDLVKDGQDTVGTEIKAKIVKNKVSAPYRQALFNVVFGEGISKEAELLDFGVDLGTLTKKGAWYSYGDIQIGQGKNKSIAWLKDNPEHAQEIEESVRGML